MTPEIRKKLNHRLETKYPDLNIQNLSNDEFFEKLIQYLNTEASTTTQVLDPTTALMKVEIKMSMRHNWTVQLFDDLLDTMSKVTGGKLLDTLTQPQHTKVVDDLLRQLLRMGDGPGRFAA